MFDEFGYCHDCSIVEAFFFFSKKKFPAALLLDSGSDRYEASECKANIMSRSTNLTPAFGCVAQ